MHSSKMMPIKNILGTSEDDGLARNKPTFPPRTTVNYERNVHVFECTLLRKRVFLGAIKDLSR